MPLNPSGFSEIVFYRVKVSCFLAVVKGGTQTWLRVKIHTFSFLLITSAKHYPVLIAVSNEWDLCTVLCSINQ